MTTLKTIRLGMAGFGSGRGGGMADIGRKLTGGHVVAAAAYEPSDERFAKGCERFSAQPTRCPSVRALVEEEHVDGVIIASPNEHHLENLRELEGCRVPILLEKPLDSTWEKICDVARFCRAYQGPVVVGHCLRYAPVLRKAKALLTEGAVGRICSARFVQNCDYGPAMFHNWRRERKRAGTMLIEKATHDLDLMNWLLEANPESVYASCKRMAFGGDRPADLTCKDCDEMLTCPESHLNRVHRLLDGYLDADGSMPCCFSKAVDVPDDEMCLIQMDSGIHAVYIDAYYTPPSYHKRVYTLVGDQGVLEIDLAEETGRATVTVYPRYGTDADHAVYVFDSKGRGHHEGDRGLIEHFYAVVTSGAEPETTVEQAFVAEALGYAAMRSSEQRREVALRDVVPPDLRPILGEHLLA